MSNWHLNPIASSYLLMLLFLGLVAVALVPTFKPMPTRRRWTLIAMRLAVACLALLLMLRPTWTSTIKRPVSALIVLLFDQSRSMQVPDIAGGKTRWSAQREMLNNAAPILAGMPENVEVQVYGFDSEAHEWKRSGDEFLAADDPGGDSTDHGTSLDDVLRKTRGKRLAAAFLSGDGAQRALAPRVEMHQAARELNRLGTPLYTIAFGQDIEKSQARDLAVENLRDQYTVFVKNELLIPAALRVRGFVNQPVSVELVVEDSAGHETVIGPIQKTAREDGEIIPLEFNYTPQVEGQYRLTLRAAEMPGELVTTNNQQSAFLTVLSGGLKVLYLEGELRHEYTFLRRSLGSSPDIQLEDIWIDPRQRERWPLDFTAKFNDPKYDVFLLGSVDSGAINTESQQALANAVAGGKGLLMMGGRHSFGPGRWAGTPLAAAIPIEMNANEKQDFDAPLRDDRHWPGPLSMLPSRRHYITDLAATEAENRLLWQGLKPLRGANRFDRLSPRGMTLAATPDDKPLLVAANYGDGRVLALAGDSTYQWVMQGAGEAHRRFWRQTILWLAQREEDVREDVWIHLPQRRFSLGGRVEFSAGVRRSDGGAVRDVALTAEVVSPDGERHSARLVPEKDEYLGLFKGLDTPGQYTIEVSASGRDRVAQAKFIVLDEDIELANPSANPEVFDALSDLTKEVGGRRIAQEELVDVLTEIKNSPPQLEEEVQSRWEFGRSWGSAWLSLLALVSLLGGEWYLRKNWGLV